MSKGVALVTGASAGIGAATAKALAADGWTTHATARRLRPLQALEAFGVTVHEADVTDHAAMSGLIAALGPDLLVANAPPRESLWQGVSGSRGAPRKVRGASLFLNAARLAHAPSFRAARNGEALGTPSPGERGWNDEPPRDRGRASARDETRHARSRSSACAIVRG